MIETEYKIILDRDEFSEEIENSYRPQFNLISELANYGSRLIVRTYTRGERNIKNTVLLLTLLKHAVAMCDSVDILLSHRSTIGAKLPLRTIFESACYISWILSEDVDRKAQQYYVWHLRKKHRNNLAAIEGTPENIRFMEKLEKSNYQDALKNTIKIESELIAQNNEIQKILDLEELKEINTEFDRLKTRPFDCQWYKPFKGPNSLSDLCKKINLEVEYEIFYSSLSKISHAQAFDQHVAVKNGRIIFEKIRDVRDIETIIRMTCTFMFRIYREIISHYIPQELENFNDKYRTEWRERFNNIPKIEITGDEIIDMD